MARFVVLSPVCLLGFNFTDVYLDSLYQSSICDIFIIRLSSVVPAYFTLFVKTGGGVMNLVSGSSSSSYMDCMVFFGGECFISRQSGVRITPCSCICASVVGLIIFGNSFCGSHTFRMSTRRLPVVLFVSRIEYPFISCCLLCGVPVVAGGGFYFVCVL